MKNYKISIVMPVYNTKQEYLMYAVNSVLRQTYKDFELIIVDDGSNRPCAELCDKIEQSDTRIRVVHQEHVGVSNARNNGADLAAGDYLMYMDSDDSLAIAALQELVEVINETNAQYIFAGIQQIYAYDQFSGTDGSKKIKYHVFGKDEIDFVVRSFFTQRNSEFSNIQGIGAINRGPCARAQRTDLAKRIRFEEKLVLGEDIEWNMRLLRACDKVCFVNSIWYGYLKYEASAIHRYYGNRAKLLEDYHNLVYQRNRDFCDKDPVPYAYNMAVSFYSMVVCEYLSEVCPLSSRQKRKEIIQILKRKPWSILLKWDIFSRLPMKYKGFLIACRLGFGIDMLRREKYPGK